ncbi:MAG: hypothetical protein HKM28_03605 [Flavobacteriaceae bacterium]|nr:hypothetical protein [Flavobacteriaceae bacterium]
MKFLSSILLLGFCLFGSMPAIAQLDTQDTSVRFEAENKLPETPQGLQLPKSEVPNLTNKRSTLDANANLGKPEESPFDMTKSDDLLTYNAGKTPRAFAEDKEPKKEYGRDQALGEVRTRGASVNVLYRDHQAVDGDLVRVYVNDDIVRSSVLLGGTFQGFDIPLQPGINRVTFEALNQGESGPNTAQLHVYDDKGLIVSAKEWNLLTGYKATILVIKEE